MESDYKEADEEGDEPEKPGKIAACGRRCKASQHFIA